MSPEEQKAAEAQAAETTEESPGLLAAAIAATKQTEKSRAEELIRTLVEEAQKGAVSWDKNCTITVKKAIAGIDEVISKQLAAIMHHDKFQKLEGSWRGLNHLVMNSETGAGLKIRAMNISKNDLKKDLERAVEFDQSQIFKKLYEDEFGVAGGAPFGAMIGDYEFTTHPDDMGILEGMAGVAAASFCPFISAADATLVGIDKWTDLSKPRDLAKTFESAEYAKWRSFRDSEDAAFVTLTMPRVLSRLPYGASTKPVEEFNFEEVATNAAGESITVDHDDYCWMNASYALGTRLTDAFAQYGWCTAIRGAEGGGKVEGLPAHTFTTDDGDVDLKCPTEIAITDRREAELSGLGFLPLCHYKGQDFAVFFGAQTTKKPKKYDRPDATANAEICARLPYIMATSRFSHYLKVMGRDKIGSFMESGDVESWLNRWINNYVNGMPDAGQEMRAKYPLREARVDVREVPGAPGSYEAVAYLRPWLQMEELTTSMRLVAKIPEKK